MSSFRFIAPSGTRIKTVEAINLLVDAVLKRDKRPNLISAIKSKYNLKHCYLMSSGRAAMAMLFDILKNVNTDKNRTEIVLPGYTCYSVPAAVEIAGLTCRICDVDPDTLSYDRKQFDSIDFSKVLCVVTSNLYGLPNDLPYIQSKAKEHGCFLLDDSAQSMNAMINNQFAGTFGDIGLYSLDKGKNITSLQGGIVVTNRDDLAKAIEDQINKLPTPGLSHSIKETIKLILYWLLLRPSLYWIPARLPFMGLGKTIYTTDYYFSKYSRVLASVSYALFKRIDAITDRRRCNYTAMVNALGNNSKITHINKVIDTVKPAYLRLPLYIKDKSKRSAIIEDLYKAGIGATQSYPLPLAKLEEIRNFSIIHNNISNGSKYISEHIVTLPSSEYLSRKDIEKIQSIVNKRL